MGSENETARAVGYRGWRPSQEDSATRILQRASTPLSPPSTGSLRGPAYQREFGVVPDFRAGLHCGPVAVGELGSLRREIALIGDTMNTTARILEACRDTDNRVLASAALIERLATLPPGVTRRRLGEFPVRGKERRLELDVLVTTTARPS